MVRELSAGRKIRLRHLADRAGIARSHLWAPLSAERSATLGLIQRVAEVLDVDPLDLLRGEPLPVRRRAVRPTKRAGR